MFLLLFMLNFLYAEPMTIVVEDHKEIDVYVTPIKIINYSEATDDHINNLAPYYYTESYWRNAKVINERGTYDPITMHTSVRSLNKNTVEYVYNNCNYLLNARKCSNQNNHFLLETTVTIDDYELVVNMVLYNPNMTIASMGSKSVRSDVNWIKQQQTNVRIRGNEIVIEQLPEQKPLEWIVYSHLFDNYIRQAAHGLWLGVKIQ